MAVIEAEIVNQTTLDGHIIIRPQDVETVIGCSNRTFYRHYQEFEKTVTPDNEVAYRVPMSFLDRYENRKKKIAASDVAGAIQGMTDQISALQKENERLVRENEGFRLISETAESLRQNNEVELFEAKATVSSLQQQLSKRVLGIIPIKWLTF